MVVTIATQIICSFFGAMAFAFVINVPRSTLHFTGLSGITGWMVYWSLTQLELGPDVANFVAGFAVGIVGLFFSQLKRMPVIIFNIPGLVPLVPGATAYQGLVMLLEGKTIEANAKLVMVLLVAGSIAIGYIMSQLVSEFYFSYRRNLRLKHPDDRS